LHAERIEEQDRAISTPFAILADVPQVCVRVGVDEDNVTRQCGKLLFEFPEFLEALRVLFDEDVFVKRGSTFSAMRAEPSRNLAASLSESSGKSRPPASFFARGVL